MLHHQTSTAAQPRTAPRVWPAGAAGTDVLRFGGDYNPEQWPEEVWTQDITLMQQAGINLVSLNVFSWALLEPHEGEYEFAQLDRLMDLLAAAGVDVDLGTPTAAPPVWFWRRHPHTRPVTRDGRVLDFGSRGMVSPSSPEYRQAAVRIAGALAERYAEHPALSMWHVHNEYGAPVGEDYSEQSVAGFRRWLTDRYGDVETLNRAWGTTFWGQRYTSLEQVDAPRLSASVVNPAQRLDFARFTSDALLECFCLERDAIRAHTPGLPVTTNFMASSCPALDYWSWAREVDVVANDHYLTAEAPDRHVRLALDADLTRSLAGGRPWMLMEHSTSAVNWQPRNLAKEPGEMRRNSLSHLARGADAVMFFQFRASPSGAEKFHSAMLPHAGTDSGVWRDVVALGAELAELAPVRGSTVSARVALVWDWSSQWAQDLEWRPSTELDHRDRVVAYYTAFWRRGVAVDFVHPGADLAGYDLVVLPSLYLCTSADAARLTGFVADGGRLLVSYFSAVVDEHDRVHPGGYGRPLAEALGVWVEEFVPLAAGEGPRLGGELAVDGSCGATWSDRLRLDADVQVLARLDEGRSEGQPAVTRHPHGRGAGWYVATDPDPATLDRVVGACLEDAGIPAALLPEGVEHVVRIGERGEHHFWFNHSDRDLDLPGGAGSPGRLPAGAVQVISTATPTPELPVLSCPS